MGGSCRTYEWIEDQFCVDEMNKKSDQRNILSTLRKNRKAQRGSDKVIKTELHLEFF